MPAVWDERREKQAPAPVQSPLNRRSHLPPYRPAEHASLTGAHCWPPSAKRAREGFIAQLSGRGFVGQIAVSVECRFVPTVRSRPNPDTECFRGDTVT